MDTPERHDRAPSGRTADELLRDESERLFGSVDSDKGKRFRERLAVDGTLRRSLLEWFESGEASEKYPTLSGFLSTCTEAEKDRVFQTGGELFFRSPEDVEETLYEQSHRINQLQVLLSGQAEFETRYPAAYEVLFPTRARSADRAGLRLPSFGIYVLSNIPMTITGIRRYPRDEVDAHSSTHERRVDRSWIKRGTWDVREQDLRGILLAVLSREEYNERIAPLLDDRVLEEYFQGVAVPHFSPIRITDLRLAEVLSHDTLKTDLMPNLESLRRPINAENVFRWKAELLGRGSEIYETHSEGILMGPAERVEGHLDATSVSFAAAALLLLVDLEMPSLEKAASYRLAEQIASLAKTVKDLMKALEGAAERLDSIAANRAVGRQPRLGGEDYWALRSYRMGASLEDLARAREIQPYDSKTVRGTRDWKAKTRQALARGKKVEEELYPRATAIFANRDNPHVRDKAQKAYRSYREIGCDVEADLDYARLAREIRVGAIYKTRGHEVASAYLQLGSCIERDIQPTP